MNRLSHRLNGLRKQNKKAMGIFVTCGFPSIAATVPLMQAIDRAGTDFIELGMPFSDPLAEGKPIQRSSEQALKNGVNLNVVLETVNKFRKTSDTPVLLMGYINPIFRYGVQRFCEAAAASGVDGLILPDLPPDESLGLADSARASGLDLVYLIAPNTPEERVRLVDAASTGFVYAVSLTGLTGAKLNTTGSVQSYLKASRELLTGPLLVGFGIKNSDDAARMTTNTDGFIVGSALVEEIEHLWSDSERDSAPASDEDRYTRIESFVRTLRPSDV